MAAVDRGLATSEPTDGVDARRALRAASRALASLPLERRMAFVLCELEGLSARDAASALDSTETAVWKRVSEARRAIRDAVEGGVG